MGTLLEFIVIVTLPEHCQIYPLLFDMNEWCKTFGSQEYKILMKFMGIVSDCPNKKMHCQNTNRYVCMEMVLV